MGRLPVTIEKLKKMKYTELSELAKELRKFLIETTNEKGGHLASNLGTVELTLALYRTFDFPDDKILWDVGHQSYVHKILSGRQEGFRKFRDPEGISGFPNRNESEFDIFGTGHSSTSVSAALGLCYARDIQKEKYRVVSVIGDGSMTGGEALEAINNAALLKSGLIIVLNDNDMSISKNVGGMKNILTGIRSGRTYNDLKKRIKKALNSLPQGDKIRDSIANAKDSLKELMIPSGMIFENIGIKYLGPVDGHNIRQMEKVFSRAQKLNRPVIVHIITKKGKGFRPAEEHPEEYHGVQKGFLKKESVSKETYSLVFGRWITENAKEDPKITAITAAMAPNVGLTEFSKVFPERFFDVGIAEQHAITFAGGQAAGGLHPYVPIFSSFLQRGYDQIIHDIALQNLPVTILVDRAGIVSRDGSTHQGVFDLSYLSSIPNLTILCPKDKSELLQALDFSRTFSAPLVIRYPKGEARESALRNPTEADLSSFTLEVLKKGEKIAILSLGTEIENALTVMRELEKEKLFPTVANLRFAKPLDWNGILALAETHRLLVTLEDGMVSGGIGERIAAFCNEKGLPTKVIPIGIPDLFLPCGSKEELRKISGTDSGSVLQKIREQL